MVCERKENISRTFRPQGSVQFYILLYPTPFPVRQTRETLTLDPYQLSEAVASVSCDQFQKDWYHFVLLREGCGYDKMQNWTGPCASDTLIIIIVIIIMIIIIIIIE